MTNCTYDNVNRMTSRTYPNGVNTTYEYDGMSRLTRLKDVNSSATLFDRQYSYNMANQISQIVEPSLSRVFGYDNVDRLTSATGGVSENYVFDPVGNRTSSHRSSSYGYSPFNKLTSTQTATYNFDSNGNTASKSEGSNFWRYTWDYENRLAEASTRKQKVRYRYDALGRRVARNLGGSRELTKFTYDGDDVLVDDNFGTQTKYLNGAGIDNKLRQTTGSTTRYFLADHLGSTNALTNTSGSVTSSNSYDSFGNPSNTGFSTRYQFTGREFDNFTGLQYSRARFYDPNLGRFISEDPIGFGGGDVNLYGYVRNNPSNLSDPFGLDGTIHFYPAGGSYPQSQEDNIRAVIDSIRLNEKCRKSFRDAGLQDPSIPDIYVGPTKTLNGSENPDVARGLGLTPMGAYAGRLGREGSAAVTVSDNRADRYTLDGNPRIFYNEKAFGDNRNFFDYYFNGYWKLKEVTGHELIHAMGQPALWSWPWRHDLSRYGPYNTIMSDCGCFD